MELKQLDNVQIITTKRIKWLSTPPGVKASPHGVWSVVCIVNKTDALVCKRGIMCRVPLQDLRVYIPEKKDGESTSPKD